MSVSLDLQGSRKVQSFPKGLLKGLESTTGVLFLLMDTRINIKKQAFLEEFTGSDWDGLNFIHSRQ